MTLLTNNLPPVTEWFDGKTTVPGQPGLYQRDWGAADYTNTPDYWDGNSWYYVEDGAAPARNQDRNWRGLKEQAK